MNARTRFHRILAVPAAGLLTAALLAGLVPAPAGAQAVVTPEPTELGSAGYWVAQRIRFRP